MPPEKNHFRMERNLDLQLEETMREPGVTGVLCVDRQGLPLAAKGVAQTTSSGAISGLVKEAALLFPDTDLSPVITLEGETSNVMIKSHEKIVLAIHKVKS